MSLTTPPQAIAVGTPVQIPYPTNTPWAGVVISNLSTLLLNVQVGGQQYWLNPFTEMLYDVSSSHAPVVLNAQNITGVTVQGSSNQVQATWYADGEEPTGTWPVSLTAQELAALAAPPGQIGSPIALTNPGITNAIVAVPSNVRTLIINFATPLFDAEVPSNIEVAGETTGIIYYNQPPYLISAQGNICTIVVPFNPAADTGVSITITSANANTYTMTVFGDTTLYEESEFYNGVAQFADTGTSGNTVIAGPVRLLTLTVAANNGICQVVQGPATVLVLEQAGVVEMTFPPNTILKTGESLVYSTSGAGIASVVYAYP
jgi:hypothetical protein